MDVSLDSLIIELTGNQNKLEAFLKMLEGNEILELARTGITGLSRGADDVRYLSNDRLLHLLSRQQRNADQHTTYIYNSLYDMEE